MKTFFFLIGAVLTLAGNAQVTKVSLQASGLTCSMCSNSINKSLKTISFVENVKANIQTSSFDITFKPNTKVDFDLLKKKVEDAGFTIANFVAAINFDNIQVKNNQPVKVGDKTFYIINAKDQALNGTRQVRLVDKGFVSNKEFKKIAPAGTAGGNGVYNVTI